MTERDDFLTAYNVPRGTIAKFDRYAEMLRDWQGRINLVAASTLDPMWHRHFADSAQLATIAAQQHGVSPDTTWLDLGSGAGFPGLVLALLCQGTFHLTEATTKKCRFLAEVVDALDLGERVTVHNTRIEALPRLRADLITARACASLVDLFVLGLPHGRSAIWLLPKGRSVDAEIAAAGERFFFDRELVASRTDADARIVVARNVRRRG